MAINNQQAVFKQSSSTNSIEIYILGEIHSPDCYTAEFQAINSAEEGDEITVYINSVGGNLLTAYQFYVALNRTKAEVFISVEGDCISAATLLLVCANYFFIASHARFMFHTYRTGVYGKSHEIDAAVEHDKEWRIGLFAEIYQGFLTDKEIKKCLDGHDLYLTAEQVSERLENMNSSSQE